MFRCTMEVVMELLRQHKDTLLSILEPFLRDPTVAWSRSGRAQRSDTSHPHPTTSGAGGGAVSSISRQSTAVLIADRELNNEAKEALMKISGRLNGIYNIAHPHGERIRRDILARISNGKKTMNTKHMSTRGLGATKEEEMPLSVQGQVHRLIEEAIMEENLGKCI